MLHPINTLYNNKHKNDGDLRTNTFDPADHTNERNKHMNTKRQAATMMEDPAGASPRQLARIAGVLYLLNIVAGFIAIGGGSPLPFVGGGAGTNLHKIHGE